MDVASALSTQWHALIRAWSAWRALILVIGFFGVLAVAATYALERYISWWENQRQQAAQTAVQQLSTTLDKRLQQVWSLADRIVESHEPVALLRTANRAAMNAWEGGIIGRNPQVRLARLFQLGARHVDYDSNPPLSYAALDMLRQADATGISPPSTVLLGGQDQHIAIVHSIADSDGKRLGHLLLALDISLLQDSMKGLVFPQGYWELRQPVSGGRARILHSVGNRAFREGHSLVQKNLPHTQWQLAFWGPDSITDETRFRAKLYVWSGVGSMALVMAIGFGVHRRRTVTAPLAAEMTCSERAAKAGLKPLVASALDGLPASAANIGKPAATDAPMPGPGIGGLSNAQEIEARESARCSDTADMALSPSIFRAYDVRGVVGKTLSPEIVHVLGRAIGSEAHDRAQQSLVVGCDGRLSSPAFVDALVQGLRASGRDVIDIGRMPTPVVYFATHYLAIGSGVVVTGSHNPPAYNGLKIMLGGEILSGNAITALHERIQARQFTQGSGGLQTIEVIDEYVRRVAEDIPVALGNAFQIVVDCGNGVAGEVAPKLYRALGHDVVELHCEVDGSFPNHHPDPSQPENLRDLIRAVQESGADLGFAFDGDGDRLGVVDSMGTIIWPDRQMMLFAQNILSHTPGAAVVFDVKCSKHLEQMVERLGGKPIMWKSGHSLIRNKMQETGSLLAGEFTGHIFFGDRWYGFDDAFYAGARLLEILTAANEAPHKVFSKLPSAINTPELHIELEEGRSTELVNRLLSTNPFSGAEIETLDGLRVIYPDGWGLVRPSNTTPSLVLRFEGDTKEALERVERRFREALVKLDPELMMPF